LFPLWFIWCALRRPRPESLLLDRDTLEHDPGRQLFLGPWTSDHYLDGADPPWVRRRRRRVRRAEGSAIRLTWKGEGRDLLIVAGEEEILVGCCRREPEREWLAGVLRAWAAGRVLAGVP